MTQAPQSKRRTTEVAGNVAFPVDSTEYESTHEGGMFVRLVVQENPDNLTLICSGGENYARYDESFVGTDNMPENNDGMSLKQRNELHLKLVSAHFPKFHDENYLSTPYLAVITLGSTGWSGFSNTKSDADNQYWRCRYSDLTQAGKAFYRAVATAYPGCKLTLQT